MLSSWDSNTSYHSARYLSSPLLLINCILFPPPNPLPMLPHAISSLLATPITKRELFLVICMTVIFTFIIQFDFAQTSEDGSRSILGHSPWSIGPITGQGREGRKGDQLSLDEDDFVEEITGKDAFMGKLAGANDLGSHGTVGRWREIKWSDHDAPRTEIITHAPGET
jgi:hypothetical protein